MSAAHFGSNSQLPILMDKVQCSGNEPGLASCPFVSAHNCDHSEDVGVICTGLTSGSIQDLPYIDDFNNGKPNDLVPAPGPAPDRPPCEPFIVIGKVVLANPACPPSGSAPSGGDSGSPPADPNCGTITIGLVTIPDPSCSSSGRRLLQKLNVLEADIKEHKTTGRKLL